MSSTTFPVGPGMSAWDVTLNAAGSLGVNGDLSNLDAILEANGLDDWTPILPSGKVMIIPASVTPDPNALLQLDQFPVCNNTVNDVYDKIATIFDILSSNWILSTGFWDANSIWTVEGLWNA